MAKRQDRRLGPAGNPDYVEHGSDRHAQMLGLRKAEEDDDLVYNGWTLEDPNLFGVTATERFLMNHLRQCVNELESPPLKMQSDDPFAPNYAPPMWTPG